MLGNACFCFRPLSGNYISQFAPCEPGEFLARVSVPCRGTTFLNTPPKAKAVPLVVSVPCRGTTFLNMSTENRREENAKIVSVPCRGTTFLNLYHRKASEKALSRFRPLSGNYISQSKSDFPGVQSYFVSVPCRGTTFLNNLISPKQD